jgi:predicted O-methyltransferase YrrM
VGEFTVDWFDYYTANLERILVPFQGRPRVRMLEIGAYEGRSTIWFLESILSGPGSHLTTVDTWEGSAENDPREMDAVRERFERNTARFVAEGRLTVVVAPSQPYLAGQVANRPSAGTAGGYHIIYVDGSHTAADVLSDAVLSWALLEPGGVMVLDDYLWDMMQSEQERPRFAIDSFLACFFGQYDEILRGNQIGLRKRIPEASGDTAAHEREPLPIRTAAHAAVHPDNNARATPPPRRRRSTRTRR